MGRVLFVFLDGVGVAGHAGPANPFAQVPTPTLDAWVEGSFSAWDGARRDDGALLASAIDATLGREGLPQSATGQGALLTGQDTVSAMNGHYGPWPGPTLKRLLAEGNLFTWARAQAGPRGARHANAYPPGFFAALQGGRLRLNVPAHAAREAGLDLADLDAYRAGEAVAADLDGAYFAASGAVPSGGPASGGGAAFEAGGRLARLAAGSLLTFFDVWTTDRAGHRADVAASVDLTARLDAFLGGLLAARPDGVTVVLTSDHGNFEDLRHGRHTRRPVPLLVAGPGARWFREVRTIREVAPAIRSVWGEIPGA